MEGPWCHTEACSTQSCRSCCSPTLSPAPSQQRCGVQGDIIKLPRDFKKFLLPSPDPAMPALSQVSDVRKGQRFTDGIHPPCLEGSLAHSIFIQQTFTEHCRVCTKHFNCTELYSPYHKPVGIHLSIQLTNIN